MDNEFVPPKDPPSFGWMVTFTDLVALLLTFFVMLFAMSNVKLDNWEEMTDALSRSFNPARDQPVSTPTAQHNIATILRSRAINLDYLAVVLEEALETDPLMSQGKVFLLEDRMVVVLPGKLFFEAGEVVMKAEAGKSLLNLGGILRNVNNTITVNGHGAKPPSAGEEYKSGWDFSLARAVSVANALKQAGYSKRVSAFGFSNSQGNALAGLSEANRTLLADRVEIVVHPAWSQGR